MAELTGPFEEVITYDNPEKSRPDPDFPIGRSLHNMLINPLTTAYDIAKWQWQIAEYATYANKSGCSVAEIDPMYMHVDANGNIVPWITTKYKSQHKNISLFNTVYTILSSNKVMYNKIVFEGRTDENAKKIVIFHTFSTKFISSYNIKNSKNIVEESFNIIRKLYHIVQSGILEDLYNLSKS